MEDSGSVKRPRADSGDGGDAVARMEAAVARLEAAAARAEAAARRVEALAYPLTVDQLPDELLTRCFTFLATEDLVVACAVSRRWHAVIGHLKARDASFYFSYGWPDFLGLAARFATGVADEDAVTALLTEFPHPFCLCGGVL